ncbi:MAG TPA: hypothetical protein VJR89_09430 [Polyangiales bacterium]|nr:hypothetical protein [Polyangiales bacterium]
MSATTDAQSEGLIQVVGRGAGYLFAAHRNVLIASWTAQGTAPLIEALAEALGTFAAQHSEGISNVHIIAAGLPLANSEARTALSALMKKHDAALACVGTVLDGSGFWASATRSLIVSLQMLTPSTFAIRTCAADAELTAWLQKPHAQRTGVELDAPALERAMAEARALSHGRSL